MKHTTAEYSATDFLRSLGASEATEAPIPVLSLNNAHIHLPPNFSAFDSVAQAVALAAEQNVRVLGASNYYDYRVYNEFTRETERRGVFPLFGLEIITLDEKLVEAGIKINDPGNPGKMYVCGKGITHFDPLDAEAELLLATIRNNDSTRMGRLIEVLNTLFADAGVAVALTESGIKTEVSNTHACPIRWVYLQERHVARAFQEALFAHVPDPDRAGVLERLFGTTSRAPDNPGVVQGEIRSHLMKAGRPAYVAETFVDFDHAYRLICALGGIPCYPTLADGAQPLCAYEADPDALVADLKKRGVFCAEFIPVRNSPDVLTRYVRTMRDAGFVVTAGTEHNTPDLLPLAPACLNGVPLPTEATAIFWEGACVVAAHQFEVANDRPGFVDAQGRLHPDFVTDDARIEGFARMGAGVLSRYGRKYPAIHEMTNP